MPPEVLQRAFWTGIPMDLGIWWILRKKGHDAVCRMFSHPLGWELRLDCDGEMTRTAQCRSQEEILATEAEWRTWLRQPGWQGEP